VIASFEVCEKDTCDIYAKNWKDPFIAWKTSSKNLEK